MIQGLEQKGLLRGRYAAEKKGYRLNVVEEWEG